MMRLVSSEGGERSGASPGVPGVDRGGGGRGQTLGLQLRSGQDLWGGARHHEREHIGSEILITEPAGAARFQIEYSLISRFFIQFYIFSSEKYKLRTRPGREEGREVASRIIVLSLAGRSVTVTGQRCHCYHTSTTTITTITTTITLNSSW